MKSAITYFPAEQYHRRVELHFCVREGNRCFLDSIVTDKTSRARKDSRSEEDHVAIRTLRAENQGETDVSMMSNAWQVSAATLRRSVVSATKPSTVSTA